MAKYNKSRVLTLKLGSRPKFGNPQMATLAVGGDDIDFPGILFNCILEAHILGGPAQRRCDEQRKHSWGLIKSSDLVDNIDHLIQETVIRGRKGPISENFKLYVTGFAEFFNEEDFGCNNVTFARTANPNPDGKDHTKLTIELRKEFNNMSRNLSAAIQTAVERNKDKNVKFIDIQEGDVLNGHRFCEPGVQEPDQHNDQLWFWHYPYDEPSSDNTGILEEAADKVTQGLSIADLGAKFPQTSDYTNAIFDAIDYIKVQEVNGGDIEAKKFWSTIGSYTKAFHPQVPFHTHIRDLVIAQYKRDLDDKKHLDDKKDLNPKNTVNDPSAPDKNECHGISGHFWVENHIMALEDVDDFCAQDVNPQE